MKLNFANSVNYDDKSKRYDDDECPFVVAKMVSTFIATINYSTKLLYKEKKTSNLQNSKKYA